MRDGRRRVRRYVLGRTLREFGRHDCSDLAAGLVYHVAFAALPALLALVSLLGLVGQADAVVAGLLRFVALLAPDADPTGLAPALESLARSPAAPVTFVAGVAGALWSASNWTAAFGRAMDRIWGVPEGRSYLVMRAQLALLTVVLVLLAVVGAALAVLSPEVVAPAADVLGLGDAAVAAVRIGRWPLLVAVAVLGVSLLYAWTPDVRTPGLLRISAGALLALIVIGAASAGLAAYAARFDSYEATYGAIGSVVVVLLWLWIAHLALLLGAVLDAERERARELLRGEPAEARILLPARNRAGAARRAAAQQRDVAEGRAIREAASPGAGG